MFVSLLRRSLGVFLFAAALAPSIALAVTVQASLVPDGTYTVEVESVSNAKHALVLLANGLETTLTATGSATFSGVKPHQKLRVSIIGGKTPSFSAARR